MKIPRENIESQRNFVSELDGIKYIHYRELHKEIDSTNFQICTKVDFKAIEKNPEHKNIHETWGRLQNDCVVTYFHKSKSGSRYFIDDQENVYRFSDHWGAVASCEWTREGKGQLAMSVFESGDWEIGVANLKDFQIFRRNVDRNADILINPQWINQIIVITPLRDELQELKKQPEFKDLPVEDKKLIGESFGFFNKTLKEIEN